MEDSEIIDLYFARSERAVAETAGKYGASLHALARRILASPEDAARRGGETVPLLEELESCLPDGHGSAEDALTERELTETLNRFLGELDATECRVFLSRYYYAMSRAEIAARYGLSEGRVKYLLAHARRTLQAKLLREGITG